MVLHNKGNAVLKFKQALTRPTQLAHTHTSVNDRCPFLMQNYLWLSLCSNDLVEVTMLEALFLSTLTHAFAYLYQTDAQTSNLILSFGLVTN